MRIEISSASQFLVDLVRLNNTKTNLSDEQLERFRGNVSDILQRHYTNHWFPDKPFKGSGYRCIRINGKMDPLIARAGFMMGLAVSFLRSLFPTELTMWIDPREVSYRIGENGSICILYEVCEKKVLAKKGEDLPSAAPTEQQQQQKQQQQPAIISKTPEKSVPAPPQAPQQASSPPPALPQQQHQTPTQQHQQQQQQQVHHHHHHQQQHHHHQQQQQHQHHHQQQHHQQQHHFSPSKSVVVSSPLQQSPPMSPVASQQHHHAAAAAMQLSMFLMNNKDNNNGLIKCKESLSLQRGGFETRSLQMDRLFVSS